jgi:hypothetical protein
VQHADRAGGRRRIVGIILAGLVLAAVYVCLPRHADLTKFDPARMAAIETGMWRDYYDKRYLALFANLYEVARGEYGFSPLASLRLAIAAAGAAKAFQPSTSREQAEAALPDLVDYFGILSAAAPAPIEVEDAARTELAWWQARREAVSPEDYGLIIARVATLVYGVDGEALRRSGVIRAQAMAYRDAHEAAMSEADWAAIAEQLDLAYGLLKKALSSPVRG